MSSTVGILAEAYNAAISVPVGEPRAPSDAAAKAHHLKNGKGFANPWDSWSQLGIPQILGGMFRHRRQHGWAGPKVTEKPEVVAPSLPARSASSTEFRATWLGHACYYVEFPGGLRALFDPVFSQRCFPVQWIGIKRYTEVPCLIKDLPAVDIICISHNHYDHLDYNSILQLKKFHPRAWFFVPLGVKAWFTATGVRNVTELDWWEEREVKLTPGEANGEAKADSGPEASAKPGTITAKVGFLPSQHISARGLTDRAATLWGSWGIESGGKKLWFAGDTGYRTVPTESEGKDDYGEEYKDLPVCPAFKQIGEQRGPFDLGLIPIGAYIPRWIMSAMHANPKDSVNIFLDTKCSKALGMHWGTFVLTDEPVMEPPEKLKEALKEKGIAATGVFDTIKIGESRVF